MKFFLSLILTLFLVSSVNISFAADASPAGDMMLISSPSANDSINYELPYPGLLPDNPLYFLKAIRDKTVEFFIADPLKKAEFYLLQSDKRLNEGLFLFNKGKSRYSMAESTISKGENYFEKGISQIQLAKKQHMPVDSLIQMYRLSADKQQEVIKSLVVRSSGSVRTGLILSEKRAEKMKKLLSEL